MRVKLTELGGDNIRRGAIAEIYNHLLSDTELMLPKRRQQGNHVFHLYVVRSKRRDMLKSFLMERGIGTLIHYPVPIHLSRLTEGVFAVGTLWKKRKRRL